MSKFAARKAEMPRKPAIKPAMVTATLLLLAMTSAITVQPAATSIALASLLMGFALGSAKTRCLSAGADLVPAPQSQAAHCGDRDQGCLEKAAEKPGVPAAAGRKRTGTCHQLWTRADGFTFSSPRRA